MSVGLSTWPHQPSRHVTASTQCKNTLRRILPTFGMGWWLSIKHLPHKREKLLVQLLSTHKSAGWTRQPVCDASLQKWRQGIPRVRRLLDHSISELWVHRDLPQRLRRKSDGKPIPRVSLKASMDTTTHAHAHPLECLHTSKHAFM